MHKNEQKIYLHKWAIIGHMENDNLISDVARTIQKAIISLHEL